MSLLPKFLMLAGAAAFSFGALLFVAERLGLGSLPGDFSWRGKSFSIHVPLATSLLVSLILTVLVNLWLGKSR